MRDILETLAKLVPDPRTVVSLAILVFFFLKYDTGDDVMKGALIAAFAAAWGYWLGSSKGAKDANEQNRRQADQIVDLAKTQEKK